MFTNKLASKRVSFALIMMFLLAGVLPIQTATAAHPANLPDSLSAEAWAQITALLPTAIIPNHIDYLKASNTGASDYFGSALSLSGNTLAVGAFGESNNATGVNGDASNNSAPSAGAVYIFTRSGTTWSQQAYLKASNTEAGDSFGSVVSLSGDTLVVGAYGEDSKAKGVNGDGADNSASSAGAAYVFTRSPAGIWSQQAYLKASNTEANDLFGMDVSLSGSTLVIGAYGEDSKAQGVNGDQADNTNSSSGAAYVFTRTGTDWSQQAYLKASNTFSDDYFGYAVSVSGDAIVIGADGEDSSATGVNGNQADNSASLAGAAYVFTRTGADWSQQAYLKASNSEAGDSFGYSVSISGNSLVVGAYWEGSSATGVNGIQADNSALRSGAAYVFTRTGVVWSQQAYLKASNTGGDDVFGMHVALDGDTLIIAAYHEDSSATGVNGDGANNSKSDSGAAYGFSRSGATWSPPIYLKASNTGAGDRLGYSVSASNNTFVAGAISESSNATGVNGDQADNSATSAGAVYLYSTILTVYLPMIQR